MIILVTPTCKKKKTTREKKITHQKIKMIKTSKLKKMKLYLKTCKNVTKKWNSIN